MEQQLGNGTKHKMLGWVSLRLTWISQDNGHHKDDFRDSLLNESELKYIVKYS